MNFLFIVPKYVEPGQVYNFPLGMAYVTSYLKHKGFNVFCLNLCHYEDDPNSLVKKWIEEKQIDVFCNGGMSVHWDLIDSLLKCAKKIKPEIINVGGGAIITSDPILAMENLKIDYGVMGEGEETMADLAETLVNKKDDKYKINVVALNDELFSSNRERIVEFTNRIKEFNIKWAAQWRVKNIDEGILRLLKDSGVLYIGLGVESISDKILKSMRKETTRADIERAYTLAHNARVECTSNIILGDVEDTEETMNESIDWWFNHPEYNITLGFIMALPGSQIYEYAVSNRIIKNKIKHIKDKFPIINLTKMSNKVFNRYYAKVYYLNKSNIRCLEGKIISSVNVENIGKGRHIYSLKLECPICKTVFEYKIDLITSANPYKVIHCKECCANFKIKSKEAFPSEYNAAATFMFEKLLLLSTYLMRFPFYRKNSIWVIKSGLYVLNRIKIFINSVKKFFRIN